MPPQGKTAFPLADDRPGAQSFIASYLILGRGAVGVKARQFNAAVLAFCHRLRLPMSRLKAGHLRVFRTFCS